ncbi:MAG: hypothetical protein K6U80_16795 [Firmicutes bacterium]|nr:hypothetical protein [Bacillota bacterium]
MPLTKLKAVEQNTWLRSGGGPERDGVCYYMCNFIESDQGPWDNPGSFANALSSARDFGQGTAMMNYAKAQNLRKAPQNPLELYQNLMGNALEADRIYRGCLWVGKENERPGMPNHEIIIVTGAVNNDIVYFEPNFGFFQPSEPTLNNREALEYWINQQYRGSGWVADYFRYYNVRSNSTATPKGFLLN